MISFFFVRLVFLCLHLAFLALCVRAAGSLSSFEKIGAKHLPWFLLLDASRRKVLVFLGGKVKKREVGAKWLRSLEWHDQGEYRRIG